MTANFLFFQAISQTSSPGIERDKMRVSVHDPAAVTNTRDESSGSDHQSFLNTMKQIAKDSNSTRPSRAAAELNSSDIHTFDSADESDSGTHPADTLETGVSVTTIQSENNMDNAEIQKQQTSNFLEIIKILEKLGILDSEGGMSASKKADEILSDEESMVTLETIIARLRQNDLVPLVEMKTGLDRLRQIMTNAQTGNDSSRNDGKPLGELPDSRSTKFADLNQLIKTILTGQEDKSGSFGVHMGESESGQKPSDPFVKMNRVATKLPNDIKQAGSSQPAENSQVAFSSGNREKIDSPKLAVEAQTVEVEANEKVKEPRSMETVRTDASRLKDGLVNPAKIGTPTQAGLLPRISSPIDSGSQLSGESAQQNLPNSESSSVVKMTNDAQAAKAVSQGLRFTAEAIQDNTANNEPSPVLKMIHDSLLTKENHLRMDAVMGDELGGKIIKMDAGANDNGLLNSQNQTAEKAFEATPSSKQTDTGQDSLRTQTLDQIVRKAVIYMRNGQHEAKIDLKPEFLGHVRMQVTTENHQITVKILTEFGFVKDMVENSIQQLKADLQQQGLNIDKLEVAVSHDSDEHKHPQEKADQTKNRQRSAASISPGNQEETHEEAGDFGVGKEVSATVDYFA